MDGGSVDGVTSQLTRSLDDSSSVGLCVVALSRADGDSLDHCGLLTCLVGATVQCTIPRRLLRRRFSLQPCLPCLPASALPAK